MSLITQWFFMGEYTNYVWSAYGLVTMVLLYNVLSCRWKKKRIQQSLQIWFKQTSR